MPTDRRLLVWPHELRPRQEEALRDAVVSLLLTGARHPEPGPGPATRRTVDPRRT